MKFPSFWRWVLTSDEQKTMIYDNSAGTPQVSSSKKSSIHIYSAKINSGVDFFSRVDTPEKIGQNIVKSGTSRAAATL